MLKQRVHDISSPKYTKFNWKRADLANNVLTGRSGEGIQRVRAAPFWGESKFRRTQKTRFEVGSPSYEGLNGVVA